MELTKYNGFCEMTELEMQEVDGGGWDDFFEKMSPIGVAEFVYQLGQDFGAASVKFGRELCDFGSDIIKIFS